MTELPPVREAHGFQRTRCGCEICKVYCRHTPGALDPADLLRLCPSGADVFIWAEQHLRALIDRPYPTLVPARDRQGHCLWHFEGRCAVHENAPYCCAFFDAHMPNDEVDRRLAATIRARQEDAAANGLYHRVWLHLRARGMIAEHGNKSALVGAVRQLLRSAERNQRRLREQ
jgi:hypothetical protein